MKKNAVWLLKPFAAGLLLLMIFGLNGCKKLLDEVHDIKDDLKPKLVGNFNQVNLVANNNEYGAAVIDTLLVNAWGLAFSPTGTPWLSAQGGHVSTVYNSEGVILGISPVAIPSPADTIGGNPTGVVFNGSSTDFILSNGQAARFLFVGVDGVLSGWNGAAGKRALLIKNNVATSAYTGLAIASHEGQSYLYAADFRARRIAVFNRTFDEVNMSFNDPYLPADYSPFNIQTIGDKLYVMYAKVGPDGRDEKGLGNGVVDVYSTGGTLLKRFAKGGRLNSPWGVAQAPAGFIDDNDQGDDEDAILVGNFGDGRINAYSNDGTFLGQLKGNGDKAVEIEGLWAISFAPATATTIDANRLYFAAGPDDETHGLFGYLLKK